MRIGAELDTVLKAKAVAAAIYGLTGEKPRVVVKEDHALLSWTPEQNDRLRVKFENQMAQGPGDVRVDLLPVVSPYVTKRAVPLLLGALAIGFLIGRL